jgi:hypothetical protein
MGHMTRNRFQGGVLFHLTHGVFVFVGGGRRPSPPNHPVGWWGRGSKNERFCWQNWSGQLILAQFLVHLLEENSESGPFIAKFCTFWSARLPRSSLTGLAISRPDGPRGVFLLARIPRSRSLQQERLRDLLRHPPSRQIASCAKELRIPVGSFRAGTGQE